MTEKEKYEEWLSREDLNAEVRAQLEAMRGKDTEIFESFYRDLEFGTAGLRGILGAGTNRMNIYTVGKATMGFARYLKENFKAPSVAIAYDCRKNSRLFAWVSARIMAANGIRVYIYSELMPTPMLSYAVRYYHCEGGIVITASHNPAQYNGYKVYGPDGCQAGPEMADAILNYINRIGVFDACLAQEKDAHITVIPQSVIDDYIDTITSLRVTEDPEAVKALKVVYTPLNGTGRMPVAKMMQKIGLTQVSVVPEQEMPDENFTTCPYPNPENREALAMGIELGKRTQPDIVLATDPEADRVGIAVNHKGEYILVTGNEMGVLLLDYICRVKEANHTMPRNPVAVKTIVTTAMVDEVAAYHHVKLESVLTGFKFIGEIISSLEAQGRLEDYLLGFEESYGYLASGHVRDKDAVSTSMLICDMAAYYKKREKTLIDVLEELSEKFGYYKNRTVSFSFEGASGMEKMAAIMERLRSDMPPEIAGARIVEASDYRASVTTDNNGQRPILLPKSNVLGYKLADDCSFVVRPSGTEPKLKVYIFAKADSAQKALERIDALKEALHVVIK